MVQTGVRVTGALHRHLFIEENGGICYADAIQENQDTGIRLGYPSARHRNHLARRPIIAVWRAFSL